MASKVEEELGEALDALMEAAHDCGIADADGYGPACQLADAVLLKARARVDALIAAVREEERERCVARVMREGLMDNTGTREDEAYNAAIRHAVEAIRNAD